MASNGSVSVFFAFGSWPAWIAAALSSGSAELWASYFAVVLSRLDSTLHGGRFIHILTDSSVTCSWANKFLVSRSRIASVLLRELHDSSLVSSPAVPLHFSHRRRAFNQGADLLSKQDCEGFKTFVWQSFPFS